MTALTSPWPDLDKHLTLSPGSLVVVAGASSSGTSMTALNFAIHAAFEQGQCAQLFSLEMANGSIMERVVANRAMVNSEHLFRTSLLTDEESERLAALKAEGVHAPLAAVDGPFSVDRIRELVRASVAQEDPLRIAVVDGMPLIHAVDPWSVENAERAAQALKLIAVEYSIVIVASTHLEPLGSDRGNVHGLDRGVSAAADAVITVSRESDTAVALYVAKSPQGAGGLIRLDWQPEYSRLTSPAPAEQAAEPIPSPTAAEAGFTQIMRDLDEEIRQTVETPWSGLDPLLQLGYRRKAGLIAQRGTHEATAGRRIAAHAAESGPVLLFTGFPPASIPENLVIDPEPSPTPEKVGAAAARMTAQGKPPRLIVIERFERMKLAERPEDCSRADELEWAGRHLGGYQGDWIPCPILMTTVVDQEPVLDKRLLVWAGIDSPAGVMTDVCGTLVILQRTDDDTVMARVELDDLISPWIVHEVPWKRPANARPAVRQVPAAPVVAAAAKVAAPAMTVDGAIQALETEYAGHRFRSRLEARWAVFFDALGIQWDYEPERYQLRSGKYLPDFWLPKQRMFFEVKGVAPADRYRRLLGELAAGRECRVVLAVGSIPRPDRFEVGVDGGSDFWMEVYDGSEAGCTEAAWDNMQAWTQCPKCQLFDVTFEARGCCTSCGCSPGNCNCGFAPDAVLAAFGSARSARFEHGESGA